MLYIMDELMNKVDKDMTERFCSGKSHMETVAVAPTCIQISHPPPRDPKPDLGSS